MSKNTTIQDDAPKTDAKAKKTEEGYYLPTMNKVVKATSPQDAINKAKENK